MSSLAVYILVGFVILIIMEILSHFPKPDDKQNNIPPNFTKIVVMLTMWPIMLIIGLFLAIKNRND
jgi:ATP/ADP translocase